ncbi:MAG: hypothetical protein VB012_03030 [Erysipelotrichaceae bacterium]|nr:hypothetical protein [Erysipelotrichaceae bacterium]
MTYKEQEKLIKYLMDRYVYLKMSTNLLYCCMESDLVMMIDFTINRLDEESRRIINYDFINKKHKYWWNEYYSRTTYYRLKNKAMSQFINCLHNGKMI